MDEKKYKTDIKSRLAQITGDAQKVLGVRGAPGASPPTKGEGPPQKP